MMSTKS